MIRRILGVLMLCLGTLLLGWIGYNLLIERQPQTKNMSPIPALLFCSGLFYVGIRWVRGQVAG